eukprot:scaffold5681_cov196-Alexandrium_tamarense.AAC.21
MAARSTPNAEVPGSSPGYRFLFFNFLSAGPDTSRVISDVRNRTFAPPPSDSATSISTLPQ